MNTLHLIFAEIRFRPGNFLLCTLAVLAAAALFAAAPLLIGGYARDTTDRLNTLETETDRMLAEMDTKTTRLMRDLGFNLRIVHRDTNMGDLYTDFRAVDMPEEYVHRLAGSEQLTLIRHLVATLEEKIKWRERTALLVGVLPESPQPHMTEKSPMGYNIAPGTVLVGSELAGDLKKGDSIEILDRSFRVADILPEHGTREDVMLAVHLHDAQQLLGKPEAINQIMALECKCTGARLPQLRAELEKILPETKITEHLTRAVARAEQRDLVAQNGKLLMEQLVTSRESTQRILARVFQFIVPTAVLFAIFFIAAMTWLNVRSRRTEIGLLRALGKTTGRIAAMLLGKAALGGLIGGAFGLCAGWLLAWLLAANLEIPAAYLVPSAGLIAATLLGAPLVAALAAYLPTLSAVLEEPARVLTDV